MSMIKQFNRAKMTARRKAQSINSDCNRFHCHTCNLVVKDEKNIIEYNIYYYKFCNKHYKVEEKKREQNAREWESIMGFPCHDYLTRQYYLSSDFVNLNN